MLQLALVFELLLVARCTRWAASQPASKHVRSMAHLLLLTLVFLTFALCLLQKPLLLLQLLLTLPNITRRS